MFQILLEELVGLFERSNGRPSGTTWVGNAAPARYAFRYASDAWVHFILKAKEGGRTREVVVIDVTTGPPG